MPSLRQYSHPAALPVCHPTPATARGGAAGADRTRGPTAPRGCLPCLPCLLAFVAVPPCCRATALTGLVDERLCGFFTGPLVPTDQPLGATTAATGAYLIRPANKDVSAMFTVKRYGFIGGPGLDTPLLRGTVEAGRWGTAAASSGRMTEQGEKLGNRLLRCRRDAVAGLSPGTWPPQQSRPRRVIALLRGSAAAAHDRPISGNGRHHDDHDGELRGLRVTALARDGSSRRTGSAGSANRPMGRQSRRGGWPARETLESPGTRPRSNRRRSLRRPAPPGPPGLRDHFVISFHSEPWLRDSGR